MALPVRSGRQGRGPSGDPFAELATAFDRVEKLWSALPGLGPTAGWSPFADVEETDDAYLVEVELPGVKEDEVEISLRDGELTVAGEVKERQRAGILRRQSRPVGDFAYSVSLPSEVDQEHVSANLDKGVLRIRLPKSEASRPRRIPVSTAD